MSEHSEKRPAETPAGGPDEAQTRRGTESRVDQDSLEELGSREDGGSEEERHLERDLDALVEDLRRERDEYLELAQRARADFDNYRRRSTRQAEEAELRGKVQLARGIVPAIDNLERALEASDGAEGGLAAGVSLVHQEITAALENAGIESFDPLGDSFDPKLHEALSTRPAADGEAPNAVVETLARGYRIGETLIRPARVVVSA